MPLARFERLDSDRRERLLRAAAQEFAAEGFEGASLARIAEQGGVSKPALYYYFEDKADLYATVVRESWQRLSPQSRVDLQRLDRESFWPALEAFHLASFDSVQAAPWLLSVWKLAYHPPRGGVAEGAVGEVFEAARGFLRSWLRRGQELGLVRDDLPEELLIALLMAVDAAADHWLVDRWDSLGPETIGSLSVRVLGVMRSLLSPEGGGP